MTVSRRDGIARSHQSGKGKRPRRNMKDSFQQVGPLRLSRCTAAGSSSISAVSFLPLATSTSETAPSFVVPDDIVITSGKNIRRRHHYAS